MEKKEEQDDDIDLFSKGCERDLVQRMVERLTEMGYRVIGIHQSLLPASPHKPQA
jgi:hypothetical protein